MIIQLIAFTTVQAQEVDKQFNDNANGYYGFGTNINSVVKIGNEYIVGGSFSEFNGIQANKIALLDENGGFLAGRLDHISIEGNVQKITFSSNSIITIISATTGQFLPRMFHIVTLNTSFELISSYTVPFYKDSFSHIELTDSGFFDIAYYDSDPNKSTQSYKLSRFDSTGTQVFTRTIVNEVSPVKTPFLYSENDDIITPVFVKSPQIATYLYKISTQSDSVSTLFDHSFPLTISTMIWADSSKSALLVAFKDLIGIDEVATDRVQLINLEGKPIESFKGLELRNTSVLKLSKASNGLFLMRTAAFQNVDNPTSYTFYHCFDSIGNRVDQFNFTNRYSILYSQPFSVVNANEIIIHKSINQVTDRNILGFFKVLRSGEIDLDFNVPKGLFGDLEFVRSTSEKDIILVGNDFHYNSISKPVLVDSLFNPYRFYNTSGVRVFPTYVSRLTYYLYSIWVESNDGKVNLTKYKLNEDSVRTATEVSTTTIYTYDSDEYSTYVQIFHSNDNHLYTLYAYTSQPLSKKMIRIQKRNSMMNVIEENKVEVADFIQIEKTEHNVFYVLRTDSQLRINQHLNVDTTCSSKELVWAHTTRAFENKIFLLNM